MRIVRLVGKVEASMVIDVDTPGMVEFAKDEIERIISEGSGILFNEEWIMNGNYEDVDDYAAEVFYEINDDGYITLDDKGKPVLLK